jgi:hypothetical protein
VFFDAPTWCIEWAKTGRAHEVFEDTIGFVRGLEKAQIPYTFIESKHLEAIRQLNLLIVPNARVISPEAAVEIEAFVRRGGWLLLEGDIDSFVAQGFFRYPDERPLINRLGFESLGERKGSFAEFILDFEGKSYQIAVSPEDIWMPYRIPDGAASLATSRNAEAIVVTADFDKGRVICCGQLIGKAYYHQAYDDFEALLKAIATSAGAIPEIKIETKLPLQWRFGKTGAENLLFLVNSSTSQDVNIFIPSITNGKLLNITNDEVITARREEKGWRLSLKADAVSYNILCWKEEEKNNDQAV